MQNTNTRFISFCSWYTSLPWLASLSLLVFSAIFLAVIIDQFTYWLTIKYFSHLSWRSELNTILTALLVAVPLVSFVIRLINYLHTLRREQINLNEELEEANRVKTDFLSNMSHELRTPLNAILGFAQLIQLDDEQLNKDNKKNLEHIVNSSNHLMKLISDILDLAKIDVGKLTFDLKNISSASLLDNSIVMLKGFAKSKHISLITHDIENHSILADEVRSKQVLVNVINNAIKYNKPGGKVDIWCQRKEDTIEYTIQDTGIGINASQLSGLFEPFNRLGADKHAIEGSGIGLALSKELIEAMHGNISCTSDKETGTIFKICFPLSKTTIHSNHEIEEVIDSDMENIAGNVLYIEDNISNQDLMHAYISKMPKLNLTIARDLRIGLEEAAKTTPDLIITDINLPDSHKDQTIQTLRDNSYTKNLPTIVLTADALYIKSITEKYENVVTLLKPVQLKLLSKAIKKLL